MTVGEMLHRMDSSEITEWMAYFAIQNEPAAPQAAITDPEALSKQLKAALFRKAK